MDWRERWRFSQYLYREVSYQSIYSLKTGNILSGEDAKAGEARPKRAERRVLQSKLTISGMFFLTFIGAAFLLRYGTQFIPTTLTPVYFDATILTMVLVVLFSLVWVTGLQVALPFVSSQVLTALKTLPLSEQDASWISLITFLKLFDMPLATAFVIFPLSVGVGTGSWAAGLATVPVVLLTEIFALSMSLATAKFFSRNVTGASGGSLIGLAKRWAYLILWTIPSLVITIFIVFVLSIIATLGTWETSSPRSLQALFTLFPYPFTYLTSVLGTRAPASLTWVAITGGAAALYIVIGLFSARWLFSAPLSLSGATTASTYVGGERRGLVVSLPPVAILKKDMRMASRTPAYAFLLLLPLLDSFILGLFTYLGSPSPALAERYAVAGVTVAVLLATFFGPVFFATEIMGFTLTRTLPISQRTLMIGKTTLISVVYIASFLVLATLVASQLHDLGGFLLYALAELPAVLAAALLEIGVLLNRAEKTGVPIANLYSGAWWTTLVVVPGLIVAVTPLIVFDSVHLSLIPPIALMALTSLLILAVIGFAVLWDKGRPL